jgi:RNA ligase
LLPFFKGIERMFPVIEHIDQIKTAIAGRDEFIIADKGDHFIVNYMVNFEDTFLNPYEAGISDEESLHRLLKRECRGLIFDQKGKIIRRPYNKFFNYMEKQDEVIDFTLPHRIMEKFDGSMCASYVANNRLIHGTKMGDTQVCAHINGFVSKNEQYNDFALDMIAQGYTPIFEFCSRKQRIVLDYPEDDMVITAIRHINTGEYLSIDKLEELGKQYEISVCRTYGTVSDIEEFLSHTAALEDKEGYVVRFDTGQQVKIKARLYLMLHHTLDNLSSEKNAIQLIIEDRLDDAKPLLDDYIVAGIDKFSHDLNAHVLSECEKILNFVATHKEKSKKEYANLVMTDPERKRLAFAYFFAFDRDPDLPAMRECLINKILFISSNKTRLDENRFMIGNLSWYDYLNLKT